MAAPTHTWELPAAPLVVIEPSTLAMLRRASSERARLRGRRPAKLRSLLGRGKRGAAATALLRRHSSW